MSDLCQLWMNCRWGQWGAQLATLVLRLPRGAPRLQLLQPPWWPLLHLHWQQQNRLISLVLHGVVWWQCSHSHCHSWCGEGVGCRILNQERPAAACRTRVRRVQRRSVMGMSLNPATASAMVIKQSSWPVSGFTFWSQCGVSRSALKGTGLYVGLLCIFYQSILSFGIWFL